MKLLEKLNGEKYLVLAACFAVMFATWLFGCRSTVPSMYDPNETVTRAVLQSEVELFIAKAEQKFATLNERDQLKKLVTDQASIVAAGGRLNPIGILTSMLGILGIGLTVDKVKQVRKIKTLNKTTV